MVHDFFYGKTLKDAVTDLVKNPSIFLLGAAVLMTSAVTAIISTTQNFYFTHIVGDLKLLSLVSMVSLVSYFAMLLMPLLIKKFGNRGSMIFAFCLIIIFSLLKYVLPVNVIWLALCGAIISCGITFNVGIRNLAMIDCMEYGRIKNGSSSEGVYSSVIGVADKVALGLGSFIVGLVMELGGFDGNLSVQPQSAIISIQLSYDLIPAICAVVGIIALLFYHVEKKLAKAKK